MAEGAGTASVFDRLERVLRGDASSWGILPVPAERRTLRGFDLAVLWGDLAIGLLVLLTGALLVPALGLPAALGAIVVGTVIGCVPLALVGLAGAREGVPGMVLFRPVLGRRGSYIPSVLNIAQLIGWTGFEFWAMSLVADRMSIRLLHHSSYWAWLAAVAVGCTALALGGPILVIRQWLEKFGAWVVAAVALWITVRLFATADVGALWRQPGTGGLPFWLAVDLVIAQPVSWLPLVADYNRFARDGVSAARSTFLGYAVGNAWFYTLGALLVLGAGLSDASPGGLGTAIASLAGGWVVLLALLVGETDEAFADIYSAAVSSQNLEARVPQRVAVLAVAALGTALAAWLGLHPNVALGGYESFLFLLGSLFVPLFGVFLADYFILRRRPPGVPGVRGRAVGAWAAGFVVYQWCVPTGPAFWRTGIETVFHQWLNLPLPLAGSAAGASLPSFAAAVAAYLLLSRLPSRAGGVAQGRSSPSSAPSSAP